jgi:hypothetical protein
LGLVFPFSDQSIKAIFCLRSVFSVELHEHRG